MLIHFSTRPNFNKSNNVVKLIKMSFLFPLQLPIKIITAIQSSLLLKLPHKSFCVLITFLHLILIYQIKVKLMKLAVFHGKVRFIEFCLLIRKERFKVRNSKTMKSQGFQTVSTQVFHIHIQILRHLKQDMF